MRKYVALVIFIFFSTLSFGQRKYAADKYFEEFAYKKAAELYEKIYENGDDSYELLSRLGDSHYLNAEFLEAEKWYGILMDKYENQATKEYLFRYAQSLKSNGKVKESDTWLLKLSEIDKNDSRAEALEENKGYFNRFTNEEVKVYANVKNLSLNTKYSDFGGFIHDNQFYFASTKPASVGDKLYKWNNQPHLNLYKANEFYDKESETVDLIYEEKITSLNSKYHESSVAITSDGKTMYFTRTSSKKQKLKGGTNQVANLKIYKAEKVGEKWGNVTELPFNNNNYSIGHPALSPDEKTLYFASNMPNGFGATDLYKVAILENNTYGEPKNLGEEINTEGREMFPFVAKDGTLYFASDGHLGLGALDVFESKLNNNTYTKPSNLGVPINGPYDDFAFVVNNEKKNGFFSSNRKEGKGDDDIYSFVFYSCKEIVEGVVLEENSKKPLPGVIVKLINSEGKVIHQTTTGGNGSYSFDDVNCNKDFTVLAEKEDFKNTSKGIETLEIDKKAITANLFLKSLIVEDQIVINPIYFDFDKYNIREDAEYELESIVSVMNNRPNMVIRIESHTDSRGTKEYNRELSDNRAKSTMRYLIYRGISPDRIESAKGFGEDQLLNNCDDANQDNCSNKEHQKNRRSYFYIVKQ